MHGQPGLPDHFLEIRLQAGLALTIWPKAGMNFLKKFFSLKCHFFIKSSYFLCSFKNAFFKLKKQFLAKNDHFQSNNFLPLFSQKLTFQPQNYNSDRSKKIPTGPGLTQLNMSGLRVGQSRLRPDFDSALHIFRGGYLSLLF